MVLSQIVQFFQSGVEVASDVLHFEVRVFFGQLGRPSQTGRPNHASLGQRRQSVVFYVFLQN